MREARIILAFRFGISMPVTLIATSDIQLFISGQPSTSRSSVQYRERFAQTSEMGDAVDQCFRSLEQVTSYVSRNTLDFCVLWRA